ncbi:MAG: DUF2087 domain-containing protein [Chloroflexi bacterium]|nr:DUF2087 domain-containing protein [Chloroflexota bacterium]
MAQENQTMTLAEQQATLVNVCKLLLDEDRLKILGLLAQQACSTETLVTQLDMARVKLHLHKLAEVGLVNQRNDQGVEAYQLDRQQILRLKKMLFARAETPEAQSPVEKELAKFVKQGQLVLLPTHPAKLLLVLQWLVEKFLPDVAYPEREVNELLKGHAEDHATLRRLLVDHGLLVRQAGIYQRPVSR